MTDGAKYFPYVREKKVTLLFSEELSLRNRFSIYPWAPAPLILWKIYTGLYPGFETDRKERCLLSSAETGLIHSRAECEHFMPFYSFSSSSAASGVSWVTELVYLLALLFYVHIQSHCVVECCKSLFCCRCWLCWDCFPRFGAFCGRYYIIKCCKIIAHFTKMQSWL